MKIVIFGATGMLGTYVSSLLSKKYQVLKITRQDYDLTDLNINILRVVFRDNDISSNDIIINCAGVIPQQKSPSKRDFYKINSLFPVILSMICYYEIECKMIHITTDCVFDGKKTGEYDETSIHTETNDYGISKSLGEICDATIIRTSIIGEQLHDKYSLLEWVKSNKGGTINGYVNHYWNGVTCLELAKYIEDIIVNNKYWYGVRHIMCEKPVSKYELLCMINEIYDLNICINKTETNIIDKTLNSVYENSTRKNIYDQIKEQSDYDLMQL